METIEIRIKNYKEETDELRKEFKRLGLQSFDLLAFQFKQIPEGIYHIDTTYIFGDQYNTTEGYRIFEKCSCLQMNTSHRQLQGYYIAEGIEKIREYQNRVKVCGYCGKQYLDSDKTICDNCLDSEYLKEDDLHLLKLLPVRESFSGKRVLTNNEMSKLLANYKIAQGLGKIKREEMQKSKNRKKVSDLIPKAIEKGQELIKEAEIKTEAYTWLLDHEINILDNVIYYSHTKRFCFGWLNGLNEKEKSKLLNILCEFPFDYDIK